MAKLSFDDDDVVWCNVVTNMIFNTCFGSIICYLGKFYFSVFLNCYFKLFGEKWLKIITGLFLYINKYEGFQNNQVSLCEIFFLGT
jgi:hypothetical protein